MAEPIWRDYTITIASIQYATFSIVTGGATIYTGKVFTKDSTNGGVSIRVNDICADYMRSQLPSRTDMTYTEDGEAKVTFYVNVTFPNSSTAQYIVDFSYDWSYDRNRSTTEVFTSDPIRKKFVAGQVLFVGYNIAPAIISGTITNTDGDVIAISVPRSADADFNNDFNADFFTSSVQMVENGTLCINLASYPDASEITIGTLTWTLDEQCSRFVMHYLNAYGGWDSLPMASGKITDNYTRSTASRLISNSDATARETTNFANVIKRKYQLHTGWLNGSGDKMHHLLGSTCVYLQDLQEGLIQPVNITDSSCEYKTYRNQGGKMVDFTVNCELAQSRKRL